MAQTTIADQPLRPVLAVQRDLVEVALSLVEVSRCSQRAAAVEETGQQNGLSRIIGGFSTTCVTWDWSY